MVSRITVLGPLTLLVVAYLVGPEIGSAQIIIAPTLPPAAPLPPPPQLFTESVPESSGRLSLKSSSWWEPPASGSDIPRWAIGHTVAFNGVGRVALSAGLFGRRGDPLPLYLSQNVTPAMQRAASDFVRDPRTSRLRWDAKFGVSAPLWNRPTLKMNAIGELFVPMSAPTGGSTPFLKSGTLPFRLGGAIGF